GGNVLFLVTNFIATAKQAQGTCPELLAESSEVAPEASSTSEVEAARAPESAEAGGKDCPSEIPPPRWLGAARVLDMVAVFWKRWERARGNGSSSTETWSPSVLDALCTEDADCPVGNPVVRGNGIKTGKCVMFNTTRSTCEIYGWCPVENATLPRKPLLAEAENFTLFIKNTVHFTKFNFSKCNTLQTSDPTYFKSCTYDPVFNPSCPVFRVRDMVEAAGETFGDLALLGGSIGVRIEWDCDLDRPAARCQPQYSFSLQGRRYNFRTASYYWDSQRRLYRNLLKLYGIRFDISVHGQATVVCDLVLLYLDAKADVYWKEKFEEAKPPKGKTEAAA
ncbi:PREDICTED: P2X purinoceptor 6-like, partial [Leptosomus discolor]|uniref:P2X purinoceptor 6-like n=1 Tax=Leptosomus discolor TaxID=188344 RepID=UPI0005223B8F